jgi:hypothetical protein
MKIRVLIEIAKKIAQNAVIFIAILTIYSTIIYYFYALNLTGVFLSVILSIISIIYLNKSTLIQPQVKKETFVSAISSDNKSGRLGKINITIYLIFLVASGLELWLGRSDTAFISPWEKINHLFFFFYAISSLTLIITIFNKDVNKKIKLLLISSYYFLSLAVAIIVYKINYGFDPFIHQAAMEVIDKAGFILPKTPYYLGQYGLIISLHKLFGISIYILNKFLVPVLATAILPQLIYRLFNIFKEAPENSKNISLMGTLLTLAFSLPLFIISTPQNLSYIFLIAAIIYGLTEKKPTKAIIFSVATAAIHPISGIPALIWSLWLLLKYKRQYLNKLTNSLINTLIIVAGAIILPLILLITSGEKINKFSFNQNAITAPLKETFSLSMVGKENWILNLTYFIQNNKSLLIFIMVIAGIILFYKKYQNYLNKEAVYIWKGLIFISASLIIAFILSSQISFQQLIIYEQSGYANRIIIIGIIFLMPFLALAINSLLIKIIDLKEKNIKIIWIILGIIFLITSLYLAYPRFDRYYNSRGYSTSKFDLEAVSQIDNQTKNNYIVLANQQVSAAALKLLGFNHYYQSKQGPIYFYPIPTGGPLYQHYLDMVYQKPDRETMQAAMNLVGVNEAYLVINKYWNSSAKIVEAAKLTADDWKTIENGEITIFKYIR